MKLSMDVDSEELSRAFKLAPAKVKQGTQNWINRSTLRTERQAKKDVPVDKGPLQSSIRSSFGNMTATVKPNKEYALPVHEGTGIYGPKKRPIVARSGKSLKIPVGGGFIFRKSIKGQRKQPFMDTAYKTVKPEVDRDAVKTLDSIVRSV